MSSKYTTMNALVKGHNISSINLIKVVGAFFSPNLHDQPFEKSLPRFESSLPHKRGFDRHLVITGLQVNLAEIFPPLSLSRRS